MMLDEARQRDGVGTVEPQVGEPVAAFELVQIVRERLLGRDILPPHHRVADHEAFARLRGSTRVAVIKPVVVAQVIGHAVVGARLEGLILLPEPWGRKHERHCA